MANAVGFFFPLEQWGVYGVDLLQNRLKGWDHGTSVALIDAPGFAQLHFS